MNKGSSMIGQNNSINIDEKQKWKKAEDVDVVNFEDNVPCKVSPVAQGSITWFHETN